MEQEGKRSELLWKDYGGGEREETERGGKEKKESANGEWRLGRGRGGIEAEVSRKIDIGRRRKKTERGRRRGRVDDYNDNGSRRRTY